MAHTHANEKHEPTPRAPKFKVGSLVTVTAPEDFPANGKPAIVTALREDGGYDLVIFNEQGAVPFMSAGDAGSKVHALTIS